jgi:ubiquitin-conjugating enzyme E2 S
MVPPPPLAPPHYSICTTSLTPVSKVSKLRRLIADHAALHEDLPPNYLFPSEDGADDMTQLTMLLAGPQGTPYSQGLWRLHLKMPEDYPKSPPKATFKTRIWHPNVEESTGAVCVDTLKRDWKSSLTLRDVLVVGFHCARVRLVARADFANVFM